MSAEGMMRVRRDKRAVVIVAEHLPADEAGAERFGGAVLAAAAGAPDLPVAMDVSKVEHLSSSALGALVQMTQHLHERGQRFFLVGVGRAVRGLLTATGLAGHFETYDSLDDALG